MSQPHDRGATLAAPGKIDERLGEFWEQNPWDISTKGHNLSSYERHRTFLNVGGHDFLDVSFLSGTDNDGDGRSAVAADLHNTGRLDLLVRNAGGRPLQLFRNEFPARHYLKVSLRGRASNRLGLGARLTATAGGLSQVREMYPVNSFRSQAPCLAHFGLGDARRVDRLVVRWPSGAEQVLLGLDADRHVVIDEGKTGPDAVQTVEPGKTFAP